MSAAGESGVRTEHGSCFSAGRGYHQAQEGSIDEPSSCWLGHRRHAEHLRQPPRLRKISMLESARRDSNSAGCSGGLQLRTARRFVHLQCISQTARQIPGRWQPGRLRIKHAARSGRPHGLSCTPVLCVRPRRRPAAARTKASSNVFRRRSYEPTSLPDAAFRNAQRAHAHFLVVYLVARYHGSRAAVR